MVVRVMPGWLLCCLTSLVVERFEEKRFWRDVRAASFADRLWAMAAWDDRLVHLGVHWKLLREF